MITEPFDEDDGRRVWLDDEEISALLDVARDAGRRRHLAFAIAVRSGLRCQEVLDVAPAHVVDDGTVGPILRVPEGKGDKYRETPIPATLAESIRTTGELRDAGIDVPLIDRSTRTLRRWVGSAADVLQERSGDDRWRFLSFHDLRRTWAGRLAAADVDQQVALQWGGWEDLETFLEHYRGSPTPEEQRRARDRVGWL